MKMILNGGNSFPFSRQGIYMRRKKIQPGQNKIPNAAKVNQSSQENNINLDKNRMPLD